MVPTPRAGTPGWPDTSLPIDIDCGSGVGWHVVQRAQQNPDRFVIGIEHTAAKYARFARRLANHPALTNSLGVHANAISWLAHNAPDGAADRIFLLYPNPNPKPGHANKRWHNMPFFSDLIRILRPAGQVVLATNELWYAEEAWERWHDTDGIAPETYRLIPPGGDHRPRSHFEAKYLRAGQTCYEITGSVLGS